MVNITKGKAVIVTGKGLRCAGPRKWRQGQSADPAILLCRHLIALFNAKGQLAGNFQCSYCKQIIEVEMS